MFGRGTRLCEDVFGPGEDNVEFYVFDYLGNFEFFRQDPKGKEADDTASLAETIFKLKARIVFGLQDGKFGEASYSEFRSGFVKDMAARVSGLNKAQFQLKQNLRYVEKYADE
jgi:type I restriction enzyme R subunit